MFLPYVIGITSLSFVAILEFRPDSGALDQLLLNLGITSAPTAWLLDGTSATVLIVLLGTYVGAGFTMIILMSGMQSIPDELYESAQIDGAGRWKQEFLVTVPLLKRYLGLLTVMGFIGAIPRLHRSSSSSPAEAREQAPSPPCSTSTTRPSATCRWVTQPPCRLSSSSSQQASP